MKYNFDLNVNRLNTNSLKWDLYDTDLPMWVADMDFKVSDNIINGFKKRIDNGVFGYNILNDEFYNSYINFWDKYHNFKIEKDWLLFSTGVIPSLSSAIRRLTNVANNVVILTPVYNIFFNSIRNNGRNILESKLIYKDNKYEIDWNDLEAKLSLSETTLLVFCNPHNPVGKIWTKDEIIKVGELCAKNNVYVISDEIHCDIVKPGLNYIPFASASDICKNISITLIAPTKCFNLAGIQTSAIVCPNKNLYNIVNRGINTDEVAEGNTLAVIAPILAFNESVDWLKQMQEYVFNNRSYAEKFIEDNIKELKVIKADATYLLWVDCNNITSDDVKLKDFIYKNTKLLVSDGAEYGDSGKGFIRINLATSKRRVIDGLNRLKKAIDLFKRN